MRQHHTKVHDSRLPNRTCVGYSREFYDEKARRKYCEECNPNTGQNNGNWKDAKKRGACRTCGTVFSYYPSNKEGVYCSDCVSSSDGLLAENPSKPVERIRTTCPNCETGLQVLRSRLDRQRRGVFCDTDCYGEWLSENVVGPAHHQWVGGAINYGQTWWRIRRQSLVRDEYECQYCGKSRKEIGRNSDVHHRIPVRRFDRPETAHSLNNVITLCRSCHRHAEAGNIEIPPSE